MEITSDTEPVAGQDYVLTCTASLQRKDSDADTQLAITWMRPGSIIKISSSTGGRHISTLTFSPLKQVYNGTYTCTATFGEFTRTMSTELAVKGRSLTVDSN